VCHYFFSAGYFQMHHSSISLRSGRKKVGEVVNPVSPPFACFTPFFRQMSADFAARAGRRRTTTPRPPPDRHQTATRPPPWPIAPEVGATTAQNPQRFRYTANAAPSGSLVPTRAVLAPVPRSPVAGQPGFRVSDCTVLSANHGAM
jgi:hypothetical protein